MFWELLGSNCSSLKNILSPESRNVAQVQDVINGIGCIYIYNIFLFGQLLCCATQTNKQTAPWQGIGVIPPGSKIYIASGCVVDFCLHILVALHQG